MSKLSPSEIAKTAFEGAYELGLTNGMTIGRTLSKIKSIFIITSKRHVCYGHGDYGYEFELACDGADGFYPAFATREQAEKILGKNSMHEITELKVQS